MPKVAKHKTTARHIVAGKKYHHHIPKHRHTKHFLKTYWPYLPMLMIVAIGILVNSYLLPRAHVLGDTTSLSASALLQDTNVQRTMYHETALTLNADLMKAAQTKANDMVRRNYWSHDTPDGRTPWTFISKAGYVYQSAGENLAYGFSSSQAVLTAWMHSPEHRANILDSSYQNVGFGIASSKNYQNNGPEVVIVAMYGQPAPASVVAASKNIPPQVNVQPLNTTSVAVGRLQLMMGNMSTWIEAAVALATSMLLVILVTRHTLKWRKVFVHSEEFIISHPWLDFGIMTIIMIGFLASRTVGYIG